MKKDKKMMAMYHRANEILNKGDELSRKLSMTIVEECSGENSDMVALLALARTVFEVVDAQMEAGHLDAMDRFITLLEGEIEAKLITLKIKH